MSPRWLIALLFIWLINLPINNWLEGDEFITSDQTNALTNTQNYTFSTSTDINGIDVLYLDKARDTWTQIIDAISFDYTFFYDVNPGTGENTPNQLMYIRYFLIVMSIVIVIFCAITIISAVKPG